MTTYNTGNPIGSKDPRDLYDNAENLDEAVNTRASESWDDRFGVARKTWWGMEQDFQQFLIDSGYVNIGDYGPGLEITARNQIFWRDGELYRAGAALELPYTTTGIWDDEGGFFKLMSDKTMIVVPSMARLVEQPRFEDTVYKVIGYYDGSHLGGGDFLWDPIISDDSDEIFVFSVPGVSDGRFIRISKDIDLFAMGVPQASNIFTDDQTELVISAIERLPDDFEGMIRAPYGVVFNINDVTPILPLGVSLDLCGATVVPAAEHYRIKRYGLATSDVMEDDTLFGVVNGHHPAFDLCNLMTSNSESANLGRGSLLWRTPTADQGPRGRPNAMLQFASNAAGTFWNYFLATYTPWRAISEGYVNWQPEIQVDQGDICKNANGFYVAASSGITGQDAPQHFFGTESDGGVDWTVLLITESARFSISEDGRVSTNGAVSPSDDFIVRGPVERNNAIFALEPNFRRTGYCRIRARPKTPEGNFVSVPSLDFRPDGVAAFETNTGARILGFDNGGGFWGIKKHRDVARAGATPAVTNLYSVRLRYPSNTNVTDFTGSVDHQEIQVMCVGPANITLTGDNFLLSGGGSVTLTPYSVITLRRVSDLTNRWVEISRSVK